MTFTTSNVLVGLPGHVDRSRRSNGSLRPGFTLIEVLLVLTVIVAMGALAWPAFTRGFETTKLKAVAERVMAACGRARVQAMTTGQTQVFRFQPNSGTYGIEALPDDSSSLDAATSSGGAAAATGSITYQLPDGFTFSGGDRVPDERSSVAESAITSTNFDTSAPPVMFYSDGTASEAQVIVANQNGRAITVSVRSLTGTAHMGEITATGQATPGVSAQ